MAKLSQALIMAFTAMCVSSIGGDVPSDTASFPVDEKWSQSFLKFEEFRVKFDRKYDSVEETVKRFRIFARNLEKIERLNAMDKGGARFGVNDMADWTDEEFRARRTNLNPRKLTERLDKTQKQIYVHADNQTVPKFKNWTEEGKVSPIKQQGNCGSCWAFATVACAESMDAIMSNSTPKDLAEQQLVDCDKESDGCNGGYMTTAIEYFIKAGGIESEETYPYTEKDGNCTANKDKFVASVGEMVQLPMLNETNMKSYVGLKGPITVGINADLLQMYMGGVFSMMACPLVLNHAMLVVGYGTTFFGRDYWILKNSWGTDWGEDGYLRILRGSNTCGLAMEVVGLTTKPQ